jgi:glucokinase
VLEQICRNHEQYHHSSLSTLPQIKYREVFLHAEHGDKCAVYIRDRSLRVWASAVVSSIHAYDPEVVVLGGGIMGAADSILPVMTEYVRRHAWTPWGEVVLRRASLGNEAPLFAAQSLFSEKQ